MSGASGLQFMTARELAEATQKPRPVYDEASDSFELFGVRYAVDLFRGLGVAPVGTVFRIAAREDGVVTLETVAAPPQSEDAA